MSEEIKQIRTLAKIANLPKILESAAFLENLGLLDEPAHAVVKRYVQANPDINEYIGKSK